MTMSLLPKRANRTALPSHTDTGDRILALDTMVVNAIGLVVLLGIAQGTRIYFEVSLIIAMLGFVSTVAYARFVLRGDIIE